MCLHQINWNLQIRCAVIFIGRHLPSPDIYLDRRQYQNRHVKRFISLSPHLNKLFFTYTLMYVYVELVLLFNCGLIPHRSITRWVVMTHVELGIGWKTK